MGLIDLLPTSKYGMGGLRPNFDISPKPPGSLHDTYSIDGNPQVRLMSTLPGNPIPQPSKFDEMDASNTSKYKSRQGQKYMDNLPK